MWMTMPKPSRGEVWFAEPPRELRGREEAGGRPVLIVSADEINQGPSNLCIVVPFTTRDRGILLHVPVDPPEGGLTVHSVLLVEQVHATDQGRLANLLGRVSPQTLGQVEDHLRIALGLDAVEAI
jgi:mRNA interferase MazF